MQDVIGLLWVRYNVSTWQRDITADKLSREHCRAAINNEKLADFHVRLCHTGITRLAHFYRVWKLPYSFEDIKKVCAECLKWARSKPRFYIPRTSHLIKTTQSMVRISMDFKGTLPSTSRNRSLPKTVDEYSRLPFTFPCPIMSAATIIHCHNQLFVVFLCQHTRILIGDFHSYPKN